MIDLEILPEVSRILPCRVGGETFCLDEGRVKAVEGREHVQRNPGPGQPHGWLLNRSDEIEVYNLAELLGLESSVEGGPMSVLVIESETAAFGLAVDRVLEPLSVGPSDQVGLPPWVQNRRAGFFTGAVRQAGALWLHLDPERLHPQALPHLPEPLPEPLRYSTEAAPKDGEASAANPAQLLVFSSVRPASQVIYGLSTRQVVEVHEMPPVVPVPTCPDFLRGMVDYRGEAVPVVDLDQFLGMETVNPLDQDSLAQAQLLVVRTSVLTQLTTASLMDVGPSWIGFPINRQIRIVDLPLACRSVEPEAHLQASRIRGIFAIENLSLIVPDIDTIPTL